MLPGVKLQQRLLATDIAAHQHLGCDLYVHDTYHTKGSFVHGKQNDKHAYRKTNRIEQGLNWEQLTIEWLDGNDLLLRIPSMPLNRNDLLENIMADNRHHFFLAGVTFCPSEHHLEELFQHHQGIPIQFSIAKPDLIEINQRNDKVEWRVNLKWSLRVKV